MHSRRHFLSRAAAITALSPLAPSTLFSKNKPAVKRGKTLVVVFLRGGIDGLNLIVPHADAHYYEHRKRIAIPRPGGAQSAIDLDGFFGLHPAARALRPLFAAGLCRAVQAVGYEHNTRSHFEEQDTWETGVLGNTVSSNGWLNRHLHSSSGHGTVRAVSIGDNLPRILRGSAPAYSVRSIEDLALPRLAGDAERIQAALKNAYCEKPGAEMSSPRGLLRQTAAATIEGAKQLESLADSEYTPANNAEYAGNRPGRNFREAARLIRAEIGIEVIALDFGGWDTHNNQGGSNGQFAKQLAELSSGLATFTRDLGDRMDDVMVLTLSDFGRTVRENGNNGTDHGWANCMLALGGPILSGQGNPVVGTWPGLAPEQLHQNRDLRHTTDFRDVIGDAVSKHLGNSAMNYLLPGHRYHPTDLLG